MGKYYSTITNSELIKLENGIDLALVKYLTYIKANMDKIDIKKVC